MSDLVKRLRDAELNYDASSIEALMDAAMQAADRIEQLEYSEKDWMRISDRYADRIEQLELVEKAFEQNQQAWCRNIARIEQLEAALQRSEKRFETLKQAYDRLRNKNIQLYGSAALEGKKDER